MQLHPAQVGQVPAGGAHDVPVVAAWLGGGPHHDQAHGALKYIIQGVHQDSVLLNKFLIIVFIVFTVTTRISMFKFICLKHPYFLDFHLIFLLDDSVLPCNSQNLFC